MKAGGGMQLGKSQLRGFKLLEPGAEIDRLMGLLANIHDPDYVTRHIDFTNWFEWTQDLPGAFYLWIIEHLFIHNELARGVLVVDGEPGEPVGDRLSDLPAGGHQGPHHAARAGLGARRPGIDSGRAHFA